MSCLCSITRVYANAKAQSIWDVLPSRPSRTTVEVPLWISSEPASWPRPPSPPVMMAVLSRARKKERDAKLERVHTPPSHEMTESITPLKLELPNELIWEAMRDAASGCTMEIETVPPLLLTTLLLLMIVSKSAFEASRLSDVWILKRIVSCISEAAQRMMPCTSGDGPDVRAIRRWTRDPILSWTTCKVDAACLCGRCDDWSLREAGLDFSFPGLEWVSDADMNVAVWYMKCKDAEALRPCFGGVADAWVIANLTSRLLRCTGLRSSAKERWLDIIGIVLKVVDHLIPAAHLVTRRYASIAAGRCSLAEGWVLWNALMSWRLQSRAAGWMLKSISVPPSIKATSLTRPMTTSECLQNRRWAYLSDALALADTK